MRKFGFLLFVLKRSYICDHIFCMNIPLIIHRAPWESYTCCFQSFKLSLSSNKIDHKKNKSTKKWKMVSLILLRMVLILRKNHRSRKQSLKCVSWNSCSQTVNPGSLHLYYKLLNNLISDSQKLWTDFYFSLQMFENINAPILQNIPHSCFWNQNEGTRQNLKVKVMVLNMLCAFILFQYEYIHLSIT